MLIFLWSSWTRSSCALRVPSWGFHSDFELKNTGNVDGKCGGKLFCGVNTIYRIFVVY